MSTGGPAARVIDGRFELVARLGGGGMGTVWRARDLVLHREVALKEVRPPDPALAEYDPEAARTLRARVLREARALARVDHPNVVTIHHIVDTGDAGYPWIVMELVPGLSLHDRLAQGPLTPVRAAAIGRELLSALRAAHAAGIQHRDVKPANVLLRPDGRPVLTDFGIAAIRESTSLTATGALIGSPDYIAPERIRGQEGHPASDLWSLGMLLYVAVEGSHPLRRASTLATLAAVLDEEVPPAAHAGPLAPVLDALLVRDPAARPAMAEVDDMLAAVGTPDGPTATRPAPPGATEPQDAVPPGARQPAAAAWAPPVPPVPPAPTGPPRRAGRRTRNTVVAVALVSAAATGTLIWVNVPALHGGATASGAVSGSTAGSTAGSAGGRTAGSTAGGSTAGSASPRVSSSQATAATVNGLLTPSGVRSVIASLKPVMGGTRVTDFTVYEEYASAEAPVKDDDKLYDRFTYRDGVATREGAGGTLGDDDTSVDLRKFNWDAVPALLRTAQKTLGVKKPTNRYLIVDPASVFDDDQPVLRVYLTDDYGGGYLVAGLNGKVIETHPR